jgi:hypothetical protein
LNEPLAIERAFHHRPFERFFLQPKNQLEKQASDARGIINCVAQGRAQGDQSDSSSAIADFFGSYEEDLFIFFQAVVILTRPFHPSPHLRSCPVEKLCPTNMKAREAPWPWKVSMIHLGRWPGIIWKTAEQ